MRFVRRVSAVAAVLVALALAPSAQAGTKIALQTEDGISLSAQESGTGTNGVVLVHNKGRTSADWNTLSEKLVAAGFHVVALDLRGHGESPLGAELTDADYPKMIDDVNAAVAWLKQNGAQKIALVGAEFGANIAANAAAHDEAITNLVLLSAGLNVKGVTVGTAIEQYGARPLLIVASSDESYPSKSALTIHEKATGDKHLAILEGAGNGTKMLTRDPDLEGVVVSWLDGSFREKQKQAQAATEKKTVGTTGTVQSIETTGKKYGEQ